MPASVWQFSTAAFFKSWQTVNVSCLQQCFNCFTTENRKAVFRRSCCAIRGLIVWLERHAHILLTCFSVFCICSVIFLITPFSLPWTNYLMLVSKSLNRKIGSDPVIMWVLMVAGFIALILFVFITNDDSSRHCRVQGSKYSCLNYFIWLHEVSQRYSPYLPRCFCRFNKVPSKA